MMRPIIFCHCQIASLMIKGVLDVMLLAENKAECCGCSACMSVCPRMAISMQPDEEGFLYPVIDEARCVKCGLCEKVCFYNGMHHVHKFDSASEDAYAVQLADADERLHSQSGGMFFAIAEYFIANGGVVYGCGLDEHFATVHKRCADIGTCEELRGSKYVQSDMKDCYGQVVRDLQAGRRVLFSGTPCQGQGLLNRIDEKYRENLFVIDIVCHGVPSPMVWQDYLKYVEGIHGSICKVNFRDKENFGWHSHVESLWSDKGRYSSMAYTDMFYSHLMMRPSCYECRFTNFSRNSDMTICDCWGIEKNMPDFDDNKGTSWVMPHTDKGMKVFADLKRSGKILARDIDWRDYLQPQMEHPISVDMDMRRKFWQNYAKYGMGRKMIGLYTRYNWRQRLKDGIKKVLGKPGCDLVRKLLPNKRK